MKKITILLISLLLIQNAYTQTKLKGNRNVIIQDRELTDFNTILIKDNLKVIINEGTTSKISVETDENLQEAIVTRVSESGVLEIYISQEISRKKKLKIYIDITDSIQKIVAKDKVNLISENEIHSHNLELIAQDYANINMKLNLDNLSLSLDDKARASLEIKAEDTINIVLDNRASLTLNSTCDTQRITLTETSSAKIAGNCNELEITSSDNSRFKGKELLSDYANVQATDKSDVYVKALKELIIKAENTAEIYIYDEPKIIVEKFTDNAILYKK